MKKFLIVMGLYTGYLFCDSLNVQTLSTLQLNTTAYDVWVKDTFAYVTADTGLMVINISDSVNPYVETVYQPGKGGAIFLRDTLAYIADLNFLLIDNISDPLNPVEIGRCSTVAYGGDVYVRGNFAYVAGGSYGLRIIDITNPLNPYEIGFNADSGINYLHISGNYAYAIAWHTFRIYDVTDSTNPVLIYNEPYLGYGPLWGICGWLNYIAITGEGWQYASGGCLYIYDVSDPYNPQRIYTLEGDTLVPWFRGVGVLEQEGLLVANAYSSYNYSGGWSFDITDPYNTRRIGQGGWGDQGIFLKPGYFYSVGFLSMKLVIKSYEWIGIREKNRIREEYPSLNIKTYKNRIKVIYSFNQKTPFEIRLIDASGKIVDILKKGNSRKGEIFIPFSKYTSGSYFIEVIYENKSIKRKINILK